MTKNTVILLLCLLMAACAAQTDMTGIHSPVETRQTMTIHDFTVTDIDGGDVSLATYSNKVVMLVNVASKCGFTSQYAGLEALYRENKDKGLVILGFPANNFMGQEPGTEQEIKSFCSLTYGVTFPMFAKISVKGKDQHPLYKFLTDKRLHGKLGGDITWNFNKFLADRNGRIIARFGSRTTPDSDEIKAAIEEALK